MFKSNNNNDLSLYPNHVNIDEIIDYFELILGGDVIFHIPGWIYKFFIKQKEYKIYCNDNIIIVPFPLKLWSTPLLTKKNY